MVVLDYLPTSFLHSTAHLALSIYSRVLKKPSPPPKWGSINWQGLYFPNPIGVAGGMDKNATHLKAWWALGAGFLEVGTVTPLPQKKNAGPTLKRFNKQQALWNHLGFPGIGAKAVAQNLKAFRGVYPTPVFANIGKNRNTDHEKSVQDYLQCILELYPYVSAFVINVSSPNTKGLSNLSYSENLKPLLLAVAEKLKTFEVKKPFFIKWGLGLSDKDFLKAFEVALECGAEGHIICNSLALGAGGEEEGSCFPNYGGISGRPVAKLSKKRLKLVLDFLGQGAKRKSQLIVSVGGILSKQDLLERLNMGADLAQVYSALVFKGPLFFKKLAARKF